MLEGGIPRTFIHWLCYFLTYRWTCVQLHNVCSSSCCFNQGLPQGSVLAPLLLLFYINNLVENLSKDAVIALLVDDVSILMTACKKEDTIAAAQSEVAKVYEWSWMWKLNLNADKLKCCPFFTWLNDSKWCPSVTVGEQQIRVNDNPQLLDVIIDCNLSLNAHVKHIKQSLSLRLWAITVTEHASWDWQKPSIQTAFHVLVRSELDYAALAWQPWLSNTIITKMVWLQQLSLWAPLSNQPL